MHRSTHSHAALIGLALLLLGGCNGGSHSGHAQIRMLNVSSGYTLLDLSVRGSSGDSDTNELSSIAYGAISDYVSVASDTYTVKFARSGVASTLRSLGGESLTDGSHATYVAYGSAGHFATLKIAEDVSAADSGQVKVQVLNTSESGSLDVYLTDESVALGDASPLVGGIASGGGSSAQMDSGTYRLRITGAGDTSDMRLDVSNLTFNSTQVVTIVLTATQGGVLVNALILPQQGSLTANQNSQARVRGAVGLATGTGVTASVGGVTILSNAPIGALGARYSEVSSGTAAVTVDVDGVAVPVPDHTLVAGADYTLLLWTNAEGTQATWVNEDNRPPSTSGKAKIRLLNGMSGNGVNATLAIDYAPIAEGIALGQASSSVEVDSGTGFQLDITDSDTSQSLISRASVSLQSDTDYTMFVAGGNTIAVTGTLRKDR
jgi:Domain of unknown function (DUF4397)